MRIVQLRRAAAAVVNGPVYYRHLPTPGMLGQPRFVRLWARAQEQVRTVAVGL